MPDGRGGFGGGEADGGRAGSKGAGCPGSSEEDDEMMTGSSYSYRMRWACSSALLKSARGGGVGSSTSENPEDSREIGECSSAAPS